MGHFILYILDSLLGLIELVIIIWVVMSLLTMFNLINDRNPVVRQIERFLDAFTRPILAPIRRFVPLLGGIDLSPYIALLIIQGVRAYLLPWLFAPIIGILGG